MPPEARRNQGALRSQITAQLTRLFGPQAADPVALSLTDWAQEPFTATAEDIRPLRSHPSYGFPPVLDSVWQGRLVFAGSEVADEFGGYLEGALASAERAVAQILAPEQEVRHGT